MVTLLAAWRVGLKLQKEAVWLILYFFLSIVWLGILAFDKSRWNTAIPPAPWAGNSFLADRTVWAGIPSQAPAGGYPATEAARGCVPAACRLHASRAAGRVRAAGRYAPPPAASARCRSARCRSAAAAPPAAPSAPPSRRVRARRPAVDASRAADHAARRADHAARAVGPARCDLEEPSPHPVGALRAAGSPDRPDRISVE